MREFLIAVVAGVVAAVLATWLWTVAVESRRKERLRKALGWTAGRYTVTLKGGKDPEPETLRISVTENRIDVKLENLTGGGRADGQIVIDERHTTSGRGFYYHEQDGERMWGFWDVQLRFPSSILVHTTYVDTKNFREVPKGYVWDRVAA